jgi:hypothetical protein
MKVFFSIFEQNVGHDRIIDLLFCVCCVNILVCIVWSACSVSQGFVVVYLADECGIPFP